MIYHLSPSLEGMNFFKNKNKHDTEGSQNT